MRNNRLFLIKNNIIAPRIMKRPIIGITTFNQKREKKTYAAVSNNYCTSVQMAGGTPILLSLCVNKEILDRYLEIMDGLIITGGDEAVNPILYGENPIPAIKATCPSRDECEAYLYKGAMKLDIPVLGICRGMQLMNVTEGGSLYQDIFTQKQDVLGHLPPDMPVDELYHSVTVEKGSKLEDIFQRKSLMVNSFHHQAVKTLAPDFIGTAISEDNVIEAMEHNSKNFAIGVQWHPEDLTIKHSEFLELFKALIEATRDSAV